MAETTQQPETPEAITIRRITRGNPAVGALYAGPGGERFRRFVADCHDMQRAGDLLHYRGRNFYEGPAVRIEGGDLQEVIRGTRDPVQWDSLGKSDLVVYPVK